MHSAVYKKILKWKKKYDTPNGWAVSQLLGSDYINISYERKKKQ